MEKKQESSGKWMILLVIILGTFMETLDSSIANLAISKMMHNFNTTLDKIQWVISAYVLSVGIVTPATRFLGDRFGIKKVYTISMAMFTLGSFLCGISWNTASAVAFRIIQGIGGAVMLTIGTTLLMATFDKKERGMAIGLMGMAVMAAPALGPTVGGYIIEKFDWRLIFFINIPIGIISLILALIVLEESESRTEHKFDFIGFLTSSIGLASILYVLGKDNIDWSDINNIVLMVIGCYSILMFIVNELMISEPMLDLRVFKNYTFCLSTIILNIAMLSLYGGIFLMPVFLQQIKGLTSFQTGLVLFPEAISIAISVVIAGILSDKPGLLIKKGMLILALIFLAINGYSMSKITLDTSSNVIMLLLMIRGLGIGFLMAPIEVVALNAIPKEMNSTASALFNTIQQISSAVGITIVTSLMQHRSAENFAILSGHVNFFNLGSMKLFNILEGMLIKSGLQRTAASGEALNWIFGIVVKQAQMRAVKDTMLIISIITILVIVPTLLLKGKDSLENEENLD